MGALAGRSEERRVGKECPRCALPIWGGWMGGGGEVSIRVCAWRCFEMAVGWLLGCLAGMCKARWEKGGERGERGLCGYMLIV